MRCRKCKEDFSEKDWESGKTYLGIDEHHNPPEFMLEEWNGEMISLCRKCHKDLHIEIRRIIFEHSTTFKPNKSDYWSWIKVIPNKRQECITEIIKFTRGWLNGEDPKEITK